jgi:hypothetical protein
LVKKGTVPASGVRLLVGFLIFEKRAVALKNDGLFLSVQPLLG